MWRCANPDTLWRRLLDPPFADPFSFSWAASVGVSLFTAGSPTEAPVMIVLGLLVAAGGAYVARWFNVYAKKSFKIA